VAILNLSTTLPLAFHIAAAVLVVFAGLFDFRERRVPNWLSLSGVLLGLALNGVTDGADGVKNALLGAGLALLIYVPLWLLHAMGAGDAKLMAAIGAIVGPRNWFAIFFVTAILGGIVAVVAVLLKGRSRQTLGNIYQILTALMHRTAPYKVDPHLDVHSSQAFRMPHAVLIAFSALLFLGSTAIYGR
jgi:prepilin peptidase CpaA